MGGKSELRNLFHVNLKCADDSYVSLFATEIPTICAPVYRPDIPLHVLQSFEELSIEAVCSDCGEVQVDVLIGLDSYWKFMKSGIIRNTGGLVAQESVFGWVLSGSLVDDGGSPSVVSHQLLCFNEVPEAALHKFWDLESIGISDAPVEAADVSAVFKQHIKRVDPMDQVEQLVASEVWLKGPKFIRDRNGNLEITTGLAGVEQNVSSVVMLVLSLLVSMSSFTVSVVMLVLSLLVSMSSSTVSSVVMLVLSLLVSMSSFTVSVVMLVLSLLVSMSSFTVSVVMLVLSLLVSMSSFTVSSVVMLVLSLLVSMSSFTVSVVMLVLSLLVSMSSFTVSVVMLVLSLLVSMSSFTVSSVVMLVLSLLVSMSSFTVSSVVMLVLSLLVSMSSFTVSVVMLVLSLLVSMSSFTVSVVMLVLSLLVSMSSFTVSVVMLVLSLLVSMSSFTVSVVMLILSLLVSMSSFTVSVVMLVLSLLVSMSSFTVSVVMLVLSLLVSMSSFTVSVVMLVLSLLVSMSSFTVSVVMLVLSLLNSMSSFVLCGDGCIVLVGLYAHPVTAKDLVARYKVRSQLVDHFWDIWSSDYIRNPPACQGDTERGHLSVGSVVHVREGCYSRMQWPIGVITRVYPGRDGIIRAFEVRTAKGTYVRSIQLLHDLQITESTECDKETPLTVTDTDDSNHVFQSSESQYVTRYGRSVKPVKKLNL